MIQIGSRPQQTTSEPDAVDLLLGCHARIRKFVALGLRVAEAGGAAPAERREAAQALHRYFTVALPRHSHDEDELVVPRLLLAHPPAALPRVLATMSGQHEDLHRLIDRLTPRWAALAASQDPDGWLKTAGAALAEDTRRLDAMFVSHLEPEETIIFPAIRELLPAHVQRELLSEIRAFRQRE